MEQLQETIVPFAGRAWRSPAGKKKQKQTHIAVVFVSPKSDEFSLETSYLLWRRKIDIFYSPQNPGFELSLAFPGGNANQKKNPKMVVVEVVRRFGGSK